MPRRSHGITAARLDEIRRSSSAARLSQNRARASPFRSPPPESSAALLPGHFVVGSGPEEGNGRILERPSTPRWCTPETCPALRSAPGRLVRFEGRVSDQRLVRSAKTGVVDRYFAADGTRFLRADVRPASRIYAGQGPNLVAEADGNRTRLGALAPTPVLKACPTLALSSGLLTSVFVFRRRP